MGGRRREGRMHIDREQFKDAINRRIKDKNLTGYQAARQIGISENTLHRMRHGKAADFNNYALICKWLGIPFEHFTGKQILKGTGDTLTDIADAIAADSELPEDRKQCLIEIMTTAYQTLKN